MEWMPPNSWRQWIKKQPAGTDVRCCKRRIRFNPDML
jgi:hypothetical protein